MGNSSSPQELTTAATTIAEELAERDRKKNNIVVYNFPENPDQTTEREKFVEMCKVTTELDVNVHKIYRLGRKTDKTRPLLVCLESEDAKLTLLSRAPKLRFHTQYKSTFIAPDMTRFQRVKHKRLVDELRKRRQQGEQNLIIKNSSNVRRNKELSQCHCQLNNNHGFHP